MNTHKSRALYAPAAVDGGHCVEHRIDSRVQWQDKHGDPGGRFRRDSGAT